MSMANKNKYLMDLVHEMYLQWPQNRTINIVFHGHSVPSGYFAASIVDTFNAYPHLIHIGLKERFPFAVINVIVTAIAGETSESGSKRFESDVLCHKPDIVAIDYGLNDRCIEPEKSESSWNSMIKQCIETKTKVMLLTPTMDIGGVFTENLWDLKIYTDIIRKLADKYELGLVDSYAAFEGYIKNGGDYCDVLSWGNHPNRRGHELVRDEFLRWFPLVYKI